jgi:large subunit ribosomal protein L20
LKKRRILRKRVKGFEGGRKNLLKVAKVAITKAGVYAYKDRKVKKRDMRALWQIRINAAARLNGLNYSELMNGLKKKGINLNRKVLSEIGAKYPEIFTSLVTLVK